MRYEKTFVDWITASQYFPEGGIPIVTSGLDVHFDPSGLPRRERNCSAGLDGSFKTSIRVASDGCRVYLSGNVGRFSRKDNLFNLGWGETQAACNRILESLGLPPFSASVGVPGTEGYRRGAVVSRLDITSNFATGSEPQARAAIRWLCGRSVSRVKRGNAGDESVWWANTRSMFEAYIKHIEMLSHKCDSDSLPYLYAKQHGLLRVEIKIRKRILSELKMNDWDDITQEGLEELYHEQTSILRTVDRSDEHDIIAALPARSRIYASAWLAGKDLRELVGRTQLYLHAKVLRQYGIDILQARNIEQFPIKVRVVDLVPCEVPEWYQKDAA